MNQVSRNEARVQISSTDQIHTFSLLPIQSSLNAHRKIEVVFKPQINQLGHLNFTFPIFNKDKNPSTPAFLLDIDQKFLNSDNKEPNWENFAALQQHNNHKPILIKPEPRHNYCHICKEIYSSYFKHIENQIHKKKLKNSAFEQHIYKMIDSFKLSKLNEKKQFKKITSDTFSDNAFRQPRKRRILQDPLTLGPKSLLLGKAGTQSTNASFELVKENKEQLLIKQL